VKPDNFVVDSDDSLVLIDFNISREFNPLTDKMMTQTGQPKFRAPETFDGTAYDSKVDIWGAGVTLYFLLSGGFLPFESERDSVLIDQIKTEEPPFKLPNI